VEQDQNPKADESRRAKRFVFRANDFYELLEKQKFKCRYSGRTLNPSNCVAEHILPLRQRGHHELANIVLVDAEVAYLKRYLTDEEVLKLAIDIVNQLGQADGFRIAKRKV